MRWDGPYLPQRVPNDPWRRSYIYKAIYKAPGEHGTYDLMSYGRNGKSGGTGENADIVSWE